MKLILKLIDNYTDRKLQRWQIKQIEQKDSLIKYLGLVQSHSTVIA